MLNSYFLCSLCLYGQEDQLNYVEFYAGQAEVHKAVSMVYPRSAATDIAYGTHLKGKHDTNPHDVLTSSGLASNPEMLKSKSEFPFQQSISISMQIK